MAFTFIVGPNVADAKKELAQRPFKIQGYFFSYTVPATKQNLKLEIKSKLDSIFFTAVYRVKKEKQHPSPSEIYCLNFKIQHEKYGMSSEVNNAHISVGKEQLPINSPFKKEGTKSVFIAVCDHLTFSPHLF